MTSFNLACRSGIVGRLVFPQLDALLQVRMAYVAAGLISGVFNLKLKDCNLQVDLPDNKQH